MVSKSIYLEGGGNSKDEHVRCREGFRKLLETCGFKGRMPRLTACGGRSGTFDDFKTALSTAKPGDFVAMLIDSEDPVANLEATWEHLKNRKGDEWEKPPGATDEQVLFMTTCMESWIVADRATLAAHFGSKLQVSALPPLVNLEQRHRHDVQDKLMHATRDCSNAYAKGKRSFEILGKLKADALKPHLPSFVRILRILDSKL